MTLERAREYLSRAHDQTTRDVFGKRLGSSFTTEPPERIADALVGIGEALIVLASPSDAVVAMRAHAAETDHPITLRLIDLDVFGVSCAGEHCNFRLEWRTT